MGAMEVRVMSYVPDAREAIRPQANSATNKLRMSAASALLIVHHMIETNRKSYQDAAIDDELDKALAAFQAIGARVEEIEAREREVVTVFGVAHV